jgi:predicted aldo/keto reductase-like oxidoreductase
MGGFHMQMRKFGKHDVEVSALGFGAMRLPVIDGDQENIDEQKAEEMFLYAIDHGVNYIDSAYVYNNGKSEEIVGKIVEKNGLRDKVYLATKCPARLVKETSDFDRFLETQFERLRTNHIDMYLMHALSRDSWPRVAELGATKFLDHLKRDGKIKFAGFSFHDDLETFKTIVDAYDWDFCQIQYNLLDEHFQAGTEGLKYAAAKGMAVVIMEPLRGGYLVRNVPEKVQEMWRSGDPNRTPANWALRWVWNHPEVSVVLSGMGKLEEVKENISIAESALPNSLSDDELKIISDVRDYYHSRIKVGCTGCRYCMPCPTGLQIPTILQFYNDSFMFDNLDILKERLRFAGGPDSCVACGKCVAACPQHLPIPDLMREISEAIS